MAAWLGERAGMHIQIKDPRSKSKNNNHGTTTTMMTSTTTRRLLFVDIQRQRMQLKRFALFARQGKLPS
jgi:D-arabinose 5-phosphate isomerase GutQ